MKSAIYYFLTRQNKPKYPSAHYITLLATFNHGVLLMTQNPLKNIQQRQQLKVGFIKYISRYLELIIIYNIFLNYCVIIQFSEINLNGQHICVWCLELH